MLNRLRMVFSECGDNQTTIAKKTGVTPAYIWKIMNKDNVTPSDPFINVVCSTYDINKGWLKTGNGEMHPEKTRAQQIGLFVSKVMDADSEFQKNFIYALSRLEERHWEALKEFVDILVEECSDTSGKEKEG